LDQIPQERYKNYEILNQQGILDSELQDHLNDLTGMRNRIVHDYNGLIDEKVIDSIDEDRPAVEKFQKVVKNWLKTQ
jgi:uncharacterized protein YutE (UPF0331/DUF86 family)